MDQRGVTMVLLAFIMPVILALGSIVIAVGNWYVHKRHLQTQVDAAAFAGALGFVGCSFQFGDPLAANDAIRAAALKYAGDMNRDPATTNLQEQQPSDVHVVLNGARYWADGDPVDDPTLRTTLDNTITYAGDPYPPPGDPSDPCETKSLDVKATDHEAPLLWDFLGLAPSPKTKAKVEIRQIKEQSGMLPWAVPEVDPAAVAAIFVNENTGAVLRSQELCRPSDCVGLVPPDNIFSYWMTPVGQDLVNIASENTGVVILVSRQDKPPALSLSGTLAQICGQAPGLVACYAGDGNQDGLTFIHGWSDTAGAPDAPQIRDVSLFSVTCGDDLSAPYFLRAGDCDLGATAVIDFGFVGNPVPGPLDGGIGAEVVLKAPGCGNQGCTMSYSGPAANPYESIWIASGAELGTAYGRANFSIEWSTEPVDGTTYSDTFPGIAHPYVADDKSGPVEYLKLGTWDPGVPDANSRNQGPDRSVTVTVGLRRPFRIEDPLVPPILLRVASPSGSRNQAFDCDRGINFQEEIEKGCQTTYALNYDDWTVPPDGVDEWADILCDRYGTGDLPPASFVNDPTPICVAIETGDKIGQFRQGLGKRFETPTCWPNEWPQDQPPAGRGPEDDAAIQEFFRTHDWANDPRYVTLIITDYTAFQGQGNDQIPIKYFAGFYATGWDVVGRVKPCLDNDPHPWYGSNYRKSLDDGDVWGHFINIIELSSRGKADEDLCNFDEVGNCIAVLVE